MEAAQIASLSLDTKDAPKIEVMPGVWRQTLFAGGKLMFCLYTLEKGSVFPHHNHHHEQAGYMISGKLNIVIGGKDHILESGHVYFAASEDYHSVEVLEDTVVLDVFSPPREDYMDELPNRD